MNTKKIAAEYRMSHWAQLIHDRMASGKNVRDYCDSIGCSENAYYYWQRKLREAACNELAPKNSIIPNGWALCKSGASIAGGTLTIEIGDIRINVTHGTDMALLSKTCQALKTLC
jgi:putative transposase